MVMSMSTKHIYSGLPYLHIKLIKSNKAVLQDKKLNGIKLKSSNIPTQQWSIVLLAKDAQTPSVPGERLVFSANRLVWHV